MSLGNICAGITASLALSFTGGATYNADLTYTQTATAGGLVHYRFPATCLGGQTCAMVQADLLAGAPMSGTDLTFQSVTCGSASAAGGGCDCDATFAPIPANESGTYTTSGGTLTTTHDGTSDEGSYCVQGSTMYQMPPITSGVTGGIVLVKQ